MAEQTPVTTDEPTKGTPLGPSISADEWDGSNNIISITKAKTEVEKAASVSEEPDSEELVGDEEEPETPEVTEPEDFVTVQNPGEFVAKDYSFEVQLADGKTVKIKSSEDADDLLDRIDADPEKVNFATTKQALNFQRKTLELEQNSKRDKDTHDRQKEEYDNQLANETQRSEATKRIASELEYLVSKGDLPKIANKYKNADWADKEVAGQPGVKEALEVLTYMSKENASRKKLGLQPLASALDAFNAMQLDSRRTKDVETNQRRAEARKAAGSRIAGGSPAPVGVTVPKGIAVGRIGRGDGLRGLGGSGW